MQNTAPNAGKLHWNFEFNAEFIACKIRHLMHENFIGISDSKQNSKWPLAHGSRAQGRLFYEKTGG
jgi:hypothetical protein